MIPFLLPAATGLLLFAAWFCALASYALRDFSRNRIDELTKSGGVEYRFSDILDQHAQALIALETGFCLSFTGLVALVFANFDLWSFHSPEPTAWLVVFSQILAILVMLVILTVVIPRTWARVGGEKVLVRAWPVIRILRKAASPLLRVAGKFDQLAHRIGGVAEPAPETLPTLTQEILSVVDEGQRQGILEPEACTMIHRVMELQQEDVASIMTPRTEMRVLHVETPLDQARNVLLDGGHSRVPVVGETTDDIIGVLYAKDLLRYIHNGTEHEISLQDIVREAIYVPETTGIDKLLERMKGEHIHIAIVIDEYSGVAGLVTLEDILEVIVGDITDEYDLEEEEDIHQITDDMIEVDARVHVDELNEMFPFDLPEDGDFDTIGGFVFNHLGRVPQNRESFTWRNLRITVLNVGKRKIHKLRIEVDRTVATTATEEG